MKPATTLPSLVLALSLSCLLHGALVFAPLAGTNIHRPTGSDRPAAKMEPFIRARLLSKTRSEAPPVVEPSIAETVLPRALPSQKTPSNQAAFDEQGLIPLAMPHYYPSESLTKRPQPVSTVDLNTPEMRSMTESGTVVLVLRISASGAVVDVGVQYSDISKPVSRSAMTVFRQMQFTPGEIDGQPVASQLKIEITYDDD